MVPIQISYNMGKGDHLKSQKLFCTYFYFYCYFYFQPLRWDVSMGVYQGVYNILLNGMPIGVGPDQVSCYGYEGT